MGDLDTVKIKHGDDFAIINRSDFDPKQHKLYGDENGDGVVSDEERDLIARKEMERRAEANRGISGGAPAMASDRNPSGTFSEPTPTDIRYPDKDKTEFENNHGAFVGKSAAQMREAKGLPDAPGGLAPVVDVEIPNDFESLSTADRRALVTKLGGGQGSKAEDVSFIQAEVDRRAGAPKAAE